MKIIFIFRITRILLLCSSFLLLVAHLQAQTGLLLNELSPDPANSEGSNDGIVELINTSGSPIDAGCTVISNSEWTIVLPTGTMIGPGETFLIACSEGQVGNPVIGTGLTCNECDFPGLPIDFDVCDPNNDQYVDFGGSGFTLDNAQVDDGDQVVVFDNTGAILDAVAWGCGSRLLSTDNTTVARNTSCALGMSSGRGGGDMSYTLGDPTWNGNGNPALRPAFLETCAQGVGFTMPAISSGSYTELPTYLNSCNSSYVRNIGATGSTTNDWSVTDFPTPSFANDVPVDTFYFTGDLEQCSDALTPITLTYEVYNYQHVEDVIENTTNGRTTDGSYVEVDGARMAWDMITPMPNGNGTTTLTYTFTPPGAGQFNLEAVWNEATMFAGNANCCGGQECYVSDFVQVNVEDRITGTPTINCTDPAAGTFQVDGITGGTNIIYQLFNTSNNMVVSQNTTGRFTLSNDQAAGFTASDFEVRIMNGCNMLTATGSVCIGDPPCPDAQDATVNGNTILQNVCSNDTLDLTVDGAASSNLPDGGTIDWYWGTDMNFDPFDAASTGFGGQFSQSSNISTSGGGSGGTMNLYTLDFDANDAGYSATSGPFQNEGPSNDDYFDITSTGFSGTYNGFTGDFFAANDIDGLSGHPDEIGEITVDPINLPSDPVTIDWAIDLAEDDANNGDEDWDFNNTSQGGDQDAFRLILIEDGTTETTLLEVSGEDDINEPPVVIMGNGLSMGSVGDEITDNAQTFAGSIMLSGTANISFRLEFDLNSGDEDIAFDDFIVDAQGAAVMAEVDTSRVPLDKSFCENSPFFIKGVVNPPSLSASCTEMDVTTNTLEVSLQCPIANLSGDTVACGPPDNPGILTLDVVGADANDVFEVTIVDVNDESITFDEIGGTDVNGEASIEITNIPDGTYIIDTIEYANTTCPTMYMGQATVQVSASPVIDITVTNPNCAESFAVVDVNVTDGNPPFQVYYTLDANGVDVDTNVVEVVYPMGQISILLPEGIDQDMNIVIDSIRDENNCVNMTPAATAVIEIDNVPAVPTADSVFCYSGSGTVNVEFHAPAQPTGITYSWYDENGNQLADETADENPLINTGQTPTAPFPDTFRAYVLAHQGTCVSLDTTEILAIYHLNPEFTTRDDSIGCFGLTVDMDTLIEVTNGITADTAYFNNLQDAIDSTSALGSSIADREQRYYVRLTSMAGCFAIDSIQIDSVVDAVAGDDNTSTVCNDMNDGGTMVDLDTLLSAMAEMGGRFETMSAVTPDGDNIVDFDGEAPGDYEYLYIAGTTCPDTAMFTVTVENCCTAPEFTTMNGMNVCPSTTVDLSNLIMVTVGASGDTSYHNTLQDATDSMNAISSTVVTTAGRYYVRVSDGPACFRIDSIEVTINTCVGAPDPIPNVMVCEGDPTIVVADTPQTSTPGGAMATAVWALDGNTAGVSTDMSVVSAGNVNLGSGVGNPDFVSGCSGNAYSSNNYTENSEANAITANDYFEFPITAGTEDLTIESISFYNRASGTGPSNYALYVENTTNIGSGSTFMGSGGTAMCASLQNITDGTTMISAGSTVNLRLYAWGGTNGNGTWRIDSFQVDVSSAPVMSGSDTTFNFYDCEAADASCLVASDTFQYDPMTAPGDIDSVWVRMEVGGVEGDSILVEVTVTALGMAGNDTMSSACFDPSFGSTMIDLDTLISAGASTTGRFEAEGASPVPDGDNIVDFNGLAEGSYSYLYIDGTMCPDTARITIEVLDCNPCVNPLVPPIVNDLSLCDGDTGLIIPTDGMSAPGGASSVFFEEDFEDATVSYTLSQAECNDGDDFFTRTDGSDINPTYNNPVGTFYFAAMDTDGDPCMQAPAQMTFDDIDISGQTNIEFCIYIAEADAANGDEDWDVTDYLHIDYDVDNSGTLTPMIWVESVPDGDDFNAIAAIDTDFDGDGDGAEITPTFTQYCFSIPVTGNLLDIVIDFNVNSGDEDIAIDQVELSGAASSTDCTFNYYDEEPESNPDSLPIASRDTLEYIADILTPEDSIWVTCTDNATGCESASSLVSIFNIENPAAPMVPMVEVCDGDKVIIDPNPGDPINGSESEIIASDDFDNPINLTNRTSTTDLGTQNTHENPFSSNGDIFGVTGGNSSSNDVFQAPFALVDDAADPNCPGFFATDNQGVVPCNYGNNFFGVVDTENGDNMGDVEASWEFDISSATSGISLICIDIGAMGDFEASDDLSWTYSIDGGTFENVLMMEADENINATYDLTNGPVTLNDPMTIDGEPVLNGLTTYCLLLDNCPIGNTITLRVQTTTNGGSEAIAFDNINIYGSAAENLVYNFYESDPANDPNLEPVFTGAQYCPDLDVSDSPSSYWVTAQSCEGCESVAAPVMVVINPLPEFTATVTNEVCPGDNDGSIILESGTAGLDYSWTGPNGFTSMDSAIFDLEPGIYTVVVTDANGCSDTDSYEIETGEDNDDPNAICNDIEVFLNSQGEVNISPEDINNGSTDNCGIESIDIDVADFTCGDIGDNTVVLTVTDVNGNVSTCESTVTVTDTISPIITCPDDILITLDAGECEARLWWNDAAATDNCSSQSSPVEVERNDNTGAMSGDVFPAGTDIEIEYIATDGSGNTSTCSFTIRIDGFPDPRHSVACNDHVNVTVDENCEAVINADMILEGGPYACYRNYIVELATDMDFNNIISSSQPGEEGAVVGSGQVGETYFVRVIDPETGNTCWGEVTIED
ncbi:MAG: HYR domain-containing protein, partial [Bacteroidetes bacterium]|nr:HYR domain-containing protein [Bacteroidota bacterium]